MKDRQDTDRQGIVLNGQVIVFLTGVVGLCTVQRRLSLRLAKLVVKPAARRYHCDRIESSSSQIRTVDPALNDQWDSERRLQTLEKTGTAGRSATHHTLHSRFTSAADRSKLLASEPDNVFQELLAHKTAAHE